MDEDDKEFWEGMILAATFSGLFWLSIAGVNGWL